MKVPHRHQVLNKEISHLGWSYTLQKAKKKKNDVLHHVPSALHHAPNTNEPINAATRDRILEMQTCFA